MNKIIYAAMAAVLSIPMSASAGLILEVDLSVTNTVTITATSGLSDATISGSDFTGFYLDEFFAANNNAIANVLVGGNLTSAENGSDGTPELFRNLNSDTGLNVWSYTNDLTSDFVAGAIAFSGSGTWTISAGAYSDALAGTGSGTVYFPADDISDLPGAMAIGTWQTASSVPLPGSLFLMATGLIGFRFARRFRH